MKVLDSKSSINLFNYSELVFPRKIIMSFFVSSFLAIIFFISIAFVTNRWAVKRNEEIFNEQQTLQVLIAKQALEENIYEFQYDVEIIQMYFREELLDRKSSQLKKDRIFQFLQTSKQEILSFIVSRSADDISYSNLTVGEKGELAKTVAKEWIKKYWSEIDSLGKRSIVPPLYITQEMQFFGYIVPVWLEGRLEGVFCVVIDLQPMISRFIFPMSMGKYGSGMLLNQDGVILFDDNVLDIGLNIDEADIFDEDFLWSFNNDILNNTLGQGEVFFSGEDGGKSRNLAAWHSFKIGDEKLILLLTATENQVSSALFDLHVQLVILGLVLILSVVLINFFLISSRKKIVQNSARSLENMVEKRTVELAMSEVRYQAIFHSVSDAILIIEKNRIVDFNKRALLMFGYSNDKMNKLSPYDVSVPFLPDAGGEVCSLKSYVRKAIYGTPQFFEWIQLREDGSSFESEISLSAVITGEGKLLIAVIRDITERKKSEKKIHELNADLELRVKQRTHELEDTNKALSDSLTELKETQKNLVEAEKMASLGVLVAGVAHEINTPIGIGVTAASHLRSQTSYILKRYGDGDIRRSELEDYINTADESSNVILENLNRASGHIKSFKHVAVDQASKEIRKFALKEYIEEVRISLNPVLKKTEHEVLISGSDELQVESVAGAVSQIITNLIMNSLKHGFEDVEKGHIYINISDESEKAVIDYSDDGAGMSEDVLVRIFDPFFTTKRGGGGSGLGMHIVYNLVTQSLKGEIECRSSVGKGTKILIKFPLGIK